jgi:hypothetical protein
LGKGFKHGGGGTFGVTVLKKTGTLTTSYTGTASVDVGFKPDIVAFDGGVDNIGTPSYPGAMFLESNKAKLSVIVEGPGTGYIFTSLNVTQAANGFSVSAQKISTTGSNSSDTGRRLSYTALKYTE